MSIQVKTFQASLNNSRYLNNCDIHYYLKHFATLIEQNILKDSNYCFVSLSIRQWSKDLKHFIPKDGLPELQG